MTLQLHDCTRCGGQAAWSISCGRETTYVCECSYRWTVRARSANNSAGTAARLFPLTAAKLTVRATPGPSKSPPLRNAYKLTGRSRTRAQPLVRAGGGATMPQSVPPKEPRQ